MIVLVFIFISCCTHFLSDAKSSFAERMELRIFFFWNGMDGGLQSDDQCCNSCEDVREAYRQKGWAIGDPEIIDQVFMIRSASGYWSFLSTTFAHFLLLKFGDHVIVSISQKVGCVGWQCKREGHLQKIKEEDGEGCNVYGHLEVNKVAGNFHFVSVNSFQQVNMLLLGFLEFQMESFNVLLPCHFCFSLSVSVEKFQKTK